MPFARADGHAQGLINACRKGECVILPRRKALLPEPHRDRQIFSQLAQPRRGRIRDRVQPARQRRSRILTGGRAAEEVVFGEITTGASNDIEQATKLARAMITRYGMSDEFDMVALETVSNQYLGGDSSLACSAQTQNEIDARVVALVKAEHEKARKLIEGDRALLDELAAFLYEKETITGDEFMQIVNKRKEAGA